MVIHLYTHPTTTACGLPLTDDLDVTILPLRASCSRCQPERKPIDSIALAAARRGNQFTRTDAALDRSRREGLL